MPNMMKVSLKGKRTAVAAAVASDREKLLDLQKQITALKQQRMALGMKVSKADKKLEALDEMIAEEPD